MEFDVKVIYVSRYNFTDEKTGEVLSGTKVTFIDQRANDTDDSFGRKVYTGILDYKELVRTCNISFSIIGFII